MTRRRIPVRFEADRPARAFPTYGRCEGLSAVVEVPIQGLNRNAEETTRGVFATSGSSGRLEVPDRGHSDNGISDFLQTRVGRVVEVVYDDHHINRRLMF